jgi:hypothetical protein
LPGHDCESNNYVRYVTWAQIEPGTVRGSALISYQSTLRFALSFSSLFSFPPLYGVSLYGVREVETSALEATRRKERLSRKELLIAALVNGVSRPCARGRQSGGLRHLDRDRADPRRDLWETAFGEPLVTAPIRKSTIGGQQWPGDAIRRFRGESCLSNHAATLLTKLVHFLAGDLQGDVKRRYPNAGSGIARCVASRELMSMRYFLIVRRTLAFRAASSQFPESRSFPRDDSSLLKRHRCAFEGRLLNRRVSLMEIIQILITASVQWRQ